MTDVLDLDRPPKKVSTQGQVHKRVNDHSSNKCLGCSMYEPCNNNDNLTDLLQALCDGKFSFRVEA